MAIEVYNYFTFKRIPLEAVISQGSFFCTDEFDYQLFTGEVGRQVLGHLTKLVYVTLYGPLT